VINSVKNRIKAPKSEIKLGIQAIDAYYGSILAGELFTVAGRTGTGKSVVMNQSLMHNAKNGIKCGVISLEMGLEELISRQISVQTGRGGNVYCSKLHKEILEQLNEDLQEIMDFPIIYWQEKVYLSTLQHVINQLVDQGCEVIYLDYSQIVQSDRLSSYERVTQVMGKLKQSALSLRVPIILGAQVNRDGDDEPSLKHLRDSGSIEQDSSMVLLIHRKLGERQAFLKLAKNRRGQVSEYLEFNFNGQRQRFE
jgi:replicative DNA helicase